MKGRIRVVSGVPTGASSPARYSIRTSFDMSTPMRDGVTLAMDVMFPDGARGSWPVILIRTPYNKIPARSQPFALELVRHGYAVAIQDCRGRFNSDGVFDPYRQEAADGFDTIEWIAAQSWCDGNIGMMGSSYVGQTQWLAAGEAPAALKAIAPTVSPPGHPFLNEPLWGGIMLMAVPEWMFAMGHRCERVAGLQGIYTQDHAYLHALPLARIAAAAGVSSSWWREWLSHPTYDDYWRSHGYEDQWPRMRVPALNVTGWWDMNFAGAPRNFVGMREHAGTQSARDGQRLVIGPWHHFVNRTRSLSGLDFGPKAVTDLDSYTLRFFDYWLRGARDNGIEDSARVHVFVIGANEWWEADDWPLPGTESTRLYLHSEGHANSHRGDGTLLGKAPAGDQPCDSFESDPLDPVRLQWSLVEGPVDDRAVSARHDVLCYTSDVLTDALDVVGPVVAVIYASSTARDCDLHVRLIDVHAEGEARFLTHGALRARFREGYGQAVFLEPNCIERFEIDMGAVGVRFERGHRIRIEIAASWFSRFERNPQTGAANWMTDEGPPIVACQKIFHTSGRESFVLLPLIPTNRVER